MKTAGCRRRTLRIFLTGLILLLNISLSACSLTSAQIKNTRSYAQSTTTLGQFSESEFATIRSGLIAMNQLLLTLDKHTSVADADFDRGARVDDTGARIAAAKALTSYGTLISALLGKDTSDDMEDAAESFADNAASAIGDDFDDDKEDALATLVEGIGSFWVEKKRAQALNSIIPRYHDTINQLADLLAEDFLADSGHMGMMKAYQVTAKRLKNASYRVVNGGDEYSYADRQVGVQALVMAEEALLRVDNVGLKAGKAVAGLKKANAELVNILHDKDYAADDIKNYARQIRDLVKIYRTLSE